MGLVSSDDGWRMPDWLWERVDSGWHMTAPIATT